MGWVIVHFDLTISALARVSTLSFSSSSSSCSLQAPLGTEWALHCCSSASESHYLHKRKPEVLRCVYVSVLNTQYFESISAASAFTLRIMWKCSVLCAHSKSVTLDISHTTPYWWCSRSHGVRIDVRIREHLNLHFNQALTLWCMLLYCLCTICQQRACKKGVMTKKKWWLIIRPYFC